MIRFSRPQLTGAPPLLSLVVRRKTRARFCWRPELRCRNKVGRVRTVSIAEIRQLPLHEKLQIMEALWDGLRANADAVLMPDWQKKLLDDHRAAVSDGRERVLEWDEVKDSLGKKHR